MSPKNKGTHGRGKAAVEEPDEFVQRVSSFSDTIQPHLKKIIAVAVLIIAGLIVWKTLGWMHEKKAKKATRAYVSALEVVEAPIVTADEPLPADGPPPAVTFPSEEDRRKAALQALAEVRSKHSSIALSELARPREARLMLEAGRFDDALAAFKAFASAANEAPEPLRMAALEGVGYSLEAKAMSNEEPEARQAGLEAALRAFADLQPNKDGPMRDYSLYHQGRLLVALGKTDEALGKFRQVLSETPDSPLTVTVESRIDVLTPAGE